MEHYRSKGRSEFAQGDYAAALDSFQCALTTASDNNDTTSQKDRQLLLSNIVACRLQLGGAQHAATAVEDAKQCIACDPTWSKAHVRLAAAYIALGDSGGAQRRRHSNDACVALQTALRYDPQNAVARSMLVQELSQRDRIHHSTSSSASRNGGFEQESSFNVDNDYVRDPPIAPSFVPPTTATTSSSTMRDSTTSTSSSFPTNVPSSSYTDVPSPARTNTAQPFSMLYNMWSQRQWNVRNGYQALQSLLEKQLERLYWAWQRFWAWYATALSDDGRTAVHVLVGLVVLYVAFGGRFGVTYLFPKSLQQQQHPYSSSSSTGYYGRYQQDRRSGTPYQDEAGPAANGGGTTYSSAQEARHTTTASQYPYNPPQQHHDGGSYEAQRRTQYQESSSRYNAPYNEHGQSSYQSRSTHNGGGYNGYYGGGGSSYSSGFSEWNGLLYLGVTALAVAIGHRFGISPWQILMVLRMMNGGGGHRRHGGFVHHGGGYGGGFGRPRRYW
jgi:tetratricopeptide (TPR) repeat protein